MFFLEDEHGQDARATFLKQSLTKTKDYTVSLIHSTAIIDPQAHIAGDVRIGPYCIIEGPVTIGPGCILHPFVRLVGPLTLGARNVIYSHAVLGDWPQDRKYHGDPSETLIGDDNVIREGVTIHRGTGAGTQTILGSRCYLMVNAHVGHNCTVADDVTLVNGSLLAGHVQVGPRAIIGGNCAIHQFCRVGRMAMISNNSAHNVDIPPFTITMTINTITQLNNVGLRRSGIPRDNINALRQMFALLFRQHRMLLPAIKDLPPKLLAFPEVQEFVAFCRASKRGVARFQPWSSQRQAGGADELGNESDAARSSL